MRMYSTGAQGFKNLSVFASSAIIAIICLFFGVSGASAQGSAATSDSSQTTAAAAQSQAGQGQQVQLEGELEIMYQDDFKSGRSKLLYSLKQSDGTRVPLKFADQAPTNHLSGEHVRVSGQMSGGSLILYSSSTKTTGGGGGTTSSGDASGSTTWSIPMPYTFGVQSTLVMLVNFQDDAVQPYTIADAQNAFFGAVNSFFQENSYGQTSITGDVVGWYTIPVSVTTCDTSQIATAAKNAATAAGVNLSAYTRYLFAFPADSACGFGGSSYVGGNPSESWINGTTGPGGTLDIHVIDHELGHAFGLWHSHLLNCGTSATICSNGTIVEYGDPMDVMGTIQTASPDYNAYQKEILGWLNYGAAPAIQTVTTSGTYTINPYELSGAGPKALKIFKGNDPATGAKVWYYLEARQAVGFDAFLSESFYYTENETFGVLFHIGTDGNGNTSDLLDMTPETGSNWFDMSLVAGQSFQDSTTGVTFAPTSVNSAGATVQITLGSCIPASPSVSVSPSQSQNVTYGTPVAFTATVVDNDSSSCAAATFNLVDTLPSGWTGVWSTTSLSLSPGKSSSATLTVASPVGTADGSYSFNVSATNAASTSYSGSAAATYVINSAPLTVSLTTNQASYLPGQTVGVSVSMLSGTLPDVGASVSVIVTSPNGKKATLSGKTGSNGVALLNYSLSRHAPAGTYTAQYGTSGTSTTTAAAATVGASTSFTVQ
jgi:M6 family metalloprotease-like protein